MSPQPSISVLMPAYDAAEKIGAALTGALTQTYAGPVEIIVVDDGSTDDTARICSAYGERIRLVRQENAGTAAARNTALAHATGEFIALCDADDVFLPPHLDAAMSAWRAAGGGRRLVTGNALLLTEGGLAHGRTVMYPPVPPPSRQRLAILEANFVPGFVLMPRSLPAELGGWDEACYLEDWDLWLRALYAGWQVVPQTAPHALYRWQPTSKSTRGDAVFAAEDALLRSVLERDGGLTGAERAYLEHRLAARSPRLLVHEADQALRAGDTATARARYAQAASLSPSNRRLQVKSASLRIPGLAALWRRRLRRIDEGIRRDTKVAR